jgi:hypothetical protein
MQVVAITYPSKGLRVYPVGRISAVSWISPTRLLSLISLSSTQWYVLFYYSQSWASKSLLGVTVDGREILECVEFVTIWDREKSSSASAVSDNFFELLNYLLIIETEEGSNLENL